MPSSMLNNSEIELKANLHTVYNNNTDYATQLAEDAITILLSIAAFFGIILNLVCFKIIHRCRYGSGSTALIFRIIAIVDSFILIGLFYQHLLFEVIQLFLGADWLDNTGLYFYYSLINLWIFHPSINILQRYTTILVLYLTFEQYLLVFKRFKKICTLPNRYSKYASFFLFLLILLPSSYEYFTYKLVYKTIYQDNQTLAISNVMPYDHIGSRFDLLYHIFYLLTYLLFPFIWYVLLISLLLYFTSMQFLKSA